MVISIFFYISFSSLILLMKFRVETIYKDLRHSIMKKNIQKDVQLSKLPLVISRLTALIGMLVIILGFIETILRSLAV